MTRNRLRKAAANGDGKAALQLADMLVDDHREEEAVGILRSCAAAGGKEVALALADILGVSGDEDYEKEAETWYRVAVEEGIDGALNDYGVFLSMLDDRSEGAERLLLQAAHSGDTLAYGNLGKLYQDQERYTEALPWLRESLAAGHATILPFLAQVETELGDGESAWKHVREAMRHDREGASLTCARYLVKFGDRHPELSAEEMFRQAVEWDGDAHFFFANWLVDEGRYGEAEIQYRLTIDHGEVNAHLNLANLLEDTGRLLEAQVELRAGIKAGDAWSAVALAYILADAGMRNDMPAVIRQAEQLGCSREDLASLWRAYHALP
ncbi:tetratricopeptide repeat protein [Streptomyces sp. NPDC003077]|uniref:tetratricopeptide repeat protein n=1 Tax=Streptomyces sp. NPDC003077 TaxID=3154443 RepID=UPI0033B2DD8D